MKRSNAYRRGRERRARVHRKTGASGLVAAKDDGKEQTQQGKGQAEKGKRLKTEKLRGSAKEYDKEGPLAGLKSHFFCSQ